VSILSRVFRRGCKQALFRHLLLPGLVHGFGERLRAWCWWGSGFTLPLAFELAQPQLADAFAKELTEPLNIVGTGERCAVFPATDIEREGGPNAVGDLLLGPAPFLACRSQQAVGRSLCCFLDHDPLRVFAQAQGKPCEDITRDTDVIYLCYSFHLSLQV
jgi:hypothetical protein